MNKNKLRSKMALFGDTYQVLANAIGIGRITLYQKLTGNTEFTRKEISAISDRYKLTNDEVVDIFGLGCEKNE